MGTSATSTCMWVGQVMVHQWRQVSNTIRSSATTFFPTALNLTLAQPDVEREEAERETMMYSDSVVLYNKYMGGVDPI